MKCFFYDGKRESEKPAFQSQCSDRGSAIARVRVEQAQAQGIVTAGPFPVCLQHRNESEAERGGLDSVGSVLIIEAL